MQSGLTTRNALRLDKNVSGYIGQKNVNHHRQHGNPSYSYRALFGSVLYIYNFSQSSQK